MREHRSLCGTMSATFNDDGHGIDKLGSHRFHLCRRFVQVTSDPIPLLFVMLNPSTANALKDDHTIRKCIGFAKRWGGFTRLDVVNLFSYRSRDPLHLKSTAGAEGDPENLRFVLEHAQAAAMVVCAWGVHGQLRDRGEAVRKRLAEDVELHHLGLTGGGQPTHPLMLSYATQPVVWSGQ